MKIISEEIGDYRNTLTNLWNDNFFVPEDSKDPFLFEIDKAFNRIKDGLFESMVLAKVFEYSIEPNSEGVYRQICVVPKYNTTEVLFASQKANIYQWEKMNYYKDNSVFGFVDVFDWDVTKQMNCEFIKAKLISSSILNKYIGVSVLFKFDDVDLIISSN